MDRERMKQVFANLLRNACQATVPGGRVSIGYKVHELGVTVRVEDNGCGIRPEHAHVIWEPFFSTKGDTGLGLGLHICKTTVEAHQGAIECRSTPGGGSLFLVTLPRPACTPPNP
jgi:signal transduction histidine kinase